MFETKKVLSAFELDKPHGGSYCSTLGWTSIDNRNTFAHICPADGEEVTTIASATAEDYEVILKEAVQAQKKWRLVPAPTRGKLVTRIAQLIAEHMDDLAGLICLDTGKSIMEAKSELNECIDMATMAAGQARMMYGFTQQSQREAHRMYDQWLPLGVVGIISAYNFPAAVWAQNGFLSVIAGNTVIWKASPKVPLTAIAMQKLVNIAMQEQNCEGVFSLFLPLENEVAELLVRDKRVAMISFTGSTGVGKKVADVVGSTLGRRYMLECSGNNGCIIDETADLELAAKSITFGVLGTTGQRCTSTRRLIVHHSVADELTQLLIKAFDQVVIGDPRDKDSLVGPLIDQAAVEQYQKTINSAVASGGKILYGGKVIERPGRYVEACLIGDIDPSSESVQHETFAPIVFMMTYETLEEAIDIHNNVVQGLASGIHSTNLKNIETFLSAAGSDCGIVRVNMGTTGADVGAAFGGEKETGGGRTAGSDAWKGYMRRQSVCVNWGGKNAWDKNITI